MIYIENCMKPLIYSQENVCITNVFNFQALLTVTSILTGISNIILGTQLNLHWAPHWFTAFIIYGSSFVYNLGAAIVPFVLTAEVFLPQVRSFLWLTYFLDEKKKMTMFFFVTIFFIIVL